MNASLQSAMTELENAEAEGLPTRQAVADAADGTTWSGQKSNEEPWSLTKNNEDSYNCMC